MERHERERGALESLRVTLGIQAHIKMWQGRFAASEAAHSEATAISAALGGDAAGWDALKVELHAWRGEEDTVRFLGGLMTGDEFAATGSGVAVNIGRSALMTLALGQGRYEEAVRIGRSAMADDFPPQGNHCLADVVEAAVRSNDLTLASTALDRLEQRAALWPTAWSTGLRARCRALVTAGDDAERGFTESIEALGRSTLTTELARSHLLFGEWLRRENRRVDARRAAPRRLQPLLRDGRPSV